MIRIWLAALTVLLLSLPGPVACQTPRAPSNFSVSANPLDLSVTGLHVQGNKILNSINQEVRLRGVNKDGAEYMCLGQFSTTVLDGPADAADVANLKSYGVNIVRLPVSEHCWLGINGAPLAAAYTAAQYRAAIVAYVNLLTQANIASIIDLQWAAPGTALAGPLSNGCCALIPMPDADHAPAFWTSVANTFKTNNAVIFDLYNEPFPDNNQDSATAWTCLRDGCTQIDPHTNSNYTAVGMQSLVATIRATGAANVIMVPGVTFTNSLSQWLAYKPTDSLGNIVASWHSYDSQTCAPQGCWDNQIAPVLAASPVIVGEIGEGDCQHVFVDPLMTWLDAHGGNYTAWAWNTYDCAGFPALISDYNGTPTGFGVGVLNHLLAVQGRPPRPQAPVTFFTATYPFGIAVGRGTNYIASDGTLYYADVAAPGLSVNNQFFASYSTGHTISGTPDPALYQTGRYGQFGTWTFGVPNGDYTVTLGMAPVTAFTQGVVNDPSTATINNMGEFGADQYIAGAKLGTCIGSSFSGSSISPYSTNPSISCPSNQSTAVPTVDAALTVSYDVSIFGQTLVVQPQSAFGGGRKTVLSTIKVAQRSLASVPAVPTGLLAVGGNGQVGLSWTASAGATSYNVFRATSLRGFYTQIAAPTASPFTDVAVSNGITYYYLISAANAAGTSAKTASVNATPALAIPSAPTGVNASAGNTQVVLSWSASSTATSYNVKRSQTNGSGYATVSSPSASPFTDTGRTNGTTYYYVVTALNSSGESGNSSQVAATPVAAGGTGVWSNVTPAGWALGSGGCGDFGVETVGADTAHAGVLYAEWHCSGIYKSTDYGQTWAGPVNTGANGANVSNCAGGITVVPNGASPIIYESCIRGSVGLWKSTDGGVNWTSINLVPPLPNGRPDIYPVSVDPYDVNHVLAMGHEQNFLLESTNGGTSWTSKTMPTNTNGGTAFAFFIDTGVPSTTANTWLWIAQTVGGADGTRRTTNAAASWTKVENNEHPHGDSQIYQPNTTGTVFMAGNYSTCGFGSVLRSTDYGATWTCVMTAGSEALVWGTPKRVYAMYGWSTSSPVGNNFYSAPAPGATGWAAASGAPSTFNGGPHQVATVNNGSNSVFICACGLSGLWRYIEP